MPSGFPGPGRDRLCAGGPGRLRRVPPRVAPLDHDRPAPERRRVGGLARGHAEGAPEPHADVEVEPVRSAPDHDHRADGPRRHLRQQRPDPELDGIAAVRHERVEDRRQCGHAAERPALLLAVDPGPQAAQGEGPVDRLAVVLLRQRGNVRLRLRPVELHAELDVRSWRGCECIVDGCLDKRGRAELVGCRENGVPRHEQRERLRERGVHGVEGLVAGQAADRDAADRHALGDDRRFRRRAGRGRAGRRRNSSGNAARGHQAEHEQQRKAHSPLHAWKSSPGSSAITPSTPSSSMRRT